MSDKISVLELYKLTNIDKMKSNAAICVSLHSPWGCTKGEIKSGRTEIENPEIYRGNNYTLLVGHMYGRLWHVFVANTKEKED